MDIYYITDCTMCLESGSCPWSHKTRGFLKSNANFYNHGRSVKKRRGQKQKQYTLKSHSNLGDDYTLNQKLVLLPLYTWKYSKLMRRQNKALNDKQWLQIVRHCSWWKWYTEFSLVLLSNKIRNNIQASKLAPL